MSMSLSLERQALETTWRGIAQRLQDRRKARRLTTVATSVGVGLGLLAVGASAQAVLAPDSSQALSLEAEFAQIAQALPESVSPGYWFTEEGPVYRVYGDADLAAAEARASRASGEVESSRFASEKQVEGVLALLAERLGGTAPFVAEYSPERDVIVIEGALSLAQVEKLGVPADLVAVLETKGATVER